MAKAGPDRWLGDPVRGHFLFFVTVEILWTSYGILWIPMNSVRCCKICSLDFYKEIVPYAKKHNIILLSDLAYAEIYFDQNDFINVLFSLFSP